MFPRPNDQDQEAIHLVGKKEDVTKAKTQIEDVIKDLVSVVTYGFRFSDHMLSLLRLLEPERGKPHGC